jgi:hypothetical protein
VPQTPVNAGEREGVCAVFCSGGGSGSGVIFRIWFEPRVISILLMKVGVTNSSASFSFPPSSSSVPPIVTHAVTTSRLPILLHPALEDSRLPQAVPIMQHQAILERGEHGLPAALLYLGVVAGDGVGDYGGGGEVVDDGAELLDELGGVVDGVVEALAAVYLG